MTTEILYTAEDQGTTVRRPHYVADAHLNILMLKLIRLLN